MHLKRLEIHGFKSFADRITLSFQKGITAIVGPNGSGKSNIADSLCWVMGEHNLRNIRGAKLEDIIFSGSEERKPLGMADVTLVLDNSDQTLPLDYSEVAVTRRVYRSGESEFLINRSPVRLKDIQELFFDTGLGREAYSVISQGKIDSILSLRPEERRSVFEEAAGIMRYKAKKNLTMKKLAETENNILRIQDLLQELVTQLEPLSEQAQKAERYLKLQDQLKQLEINYSYTELTGINQTLKELIEQQNLKNNELLRLKEEEENLSQRVISIKSRVNTVEEELEVRQKQLMEETAQRERAMGELNLFGERKRSLQTRILELEAFIAQQAEKAMDLEKKKENLSQLTTNIDEKKTRLASEVKQLEEVLLVKEVKIKEFRAELIAKKQCFTNKLEQSSLLKQKISEASVQKDFRHEKETEVHEELEEIAKELAVTDQRIYKAKDKLNALRQQLDVVKNQEEKLAAELKKRQSYLLNQVEKNQEMRERLRGLESKLTLLTDMERGHQGYFQGVKSLLEIQKEPFRREIHGVVADLIRAESGYELALEVAMGSSLQYLVINHHRDARQAIDYLKKHALGRATFLPLNLIDEKPDRLLGIKSLLMEYNSKPATDAVLYEQRYSAIVQHLLNGTIIAPNLKTAVEIAEKTGKKFRVVTLEGELIAPGGAITGGNLERRRAGLLSRKGEITQLKREKEDLLAFMNRGLAEEKKLEEEIREISQLHEEKKNLQQETNFNINSVLKDMDALVVSHQKTLTKKEQLQQVLLRIEEELSLQKSAVDNLRDKLKQVEAEMEFITGEIKALEVWETNFITGRETTLRELSDLSSQLAGVQQEWLGKRENLQNYENLIGELQTEINKKNSELAQTQEEMQILQKQKDMMESKVKNTTKNQAEQEADIQKLKSCWQEALSTLNQTEVRLREIQKQHGEEVAFLHRLDLQINRLKISADNMSTNLIEVYGEGWQQELSINWVAPSNPKHEITCFKRQMKEIEPVNLQAIAEYQALKERVDFLSQQLTDLTASRESLEKVIQEIEKTIQKRFLDTFYQVRKEFIILFEQLFSGGKANLELIDPDNPLDSGVEILAQPPGKRLQNLSLLSGGERAMTAIALLFAILRIKPSPFCILDEIDATLDDTNVKRFTELLKIFSKDLQFILITHRRGTMEVADVLYGVTMEEKGISKLISLDLKKQAS